MNTRLIIILSLIILIIAGAWYGISRWQRSVILQGERDVLLLNKKEGIYSYLSTSDTTDIDGGFKIVGFVDEFTEEEIAELTEGYLPAGSFTQAGGELPGRPARSSQLEYPEGEEVPAWESFIAQLTTEQSALCESMPTASLSQYCTIRHGVYQAFSNGQSSDTCDAIHIEAAQEECRNNLEEQDSAKLRDADQNGLLDAYEIYIGKSDFFRTQTN